MGIRAIQRNEMDVQNCNEMTLSDLVRDVTGSNVYRCYQCVKCTSGCPLSDQFDLTPNQIMRAIQLGDDTVLESKAIWLCATCYTCATRCPQAIDVTGVMDTLRIEAKRRNVKPGIPEIARFNELFMANIKRFGRVYEVGLMVAYNVVLRKPLRDFRLGLRMLARGKLGLLPEFLNKKSGTARADHGEKAIAYFPGCSMSCSAAEYGRSVESVARAMDVELVEPDGWGCCGSGAAHASDHELAVTLPMKTVAAVEKMGFDMLTSPCSACFSRLKHSEQVVRQNEDTARMVGQALGYDYQGSVEVRHLIDILLDQCGLDEIRARVSNPLAGLKVACYYGCLITRPPGVTGADDVEYPMKIDYLLRCLGAETVEWQSKTDCCGGSLGISKTEVATGLMRKIVTNARAAGAEAIVTMCPICHLNLDSRQPEMGLEEDVPILQATQLMALAFGQGAEGAALRYNLVDTRPYLKRKGVLS